VNHGLRAQMKHEVLLNRNARVRVRGEMMAV
jgi:hypothetical protein